MKTLLSDRGAINDKVRAHHRARDGVVGVAVPAVEIKDAKLPQNMQRAMAAKAKAERERRAKVVL